MPNNTGGDPAETIKVEDRQLFHVVMSTDSLSLPRPWNQKNVSDAPDQFFRYRETYPYLLKHRLETLMPTREIVISCFASRAATISHAGGRANDLVSWMEPDVLVLHHGIVDCWLRSENPDEFRCDPQEFERHLSNVIRQRDVLNPHLPIVMVGIMPTYGQFLERVPRQNTVISMYNQIFRRHVDKNNILLDMELLYGDVVDRVVHLDGHHLSRTGHVVMANELTKAIRMVLPAG